MVADPSEIPAFTRKLSPPFFDRLESVSKSTLHVAVAGVAVAAAGEAATTFVSGTGALGAELPSTTVVVDGVTTSSVAGVEVVPVTALVDPLVDVSAALDAAIAVVSALLVDVVAAAVVSAEATVVVAAVDAGLSAHAALTFTRGMVINTVASTTAMILVLASFFIFTSLYRDLWKLISSLSATDHYFSNNNLYADNKL